MGVKATQTAGALHRAARPGSELGGPGYEAGAFPGPERNNNGLVIRLITHTDTDTHKHTHTYTHTLLLLPANHYKHTDNSTHTHTHTSTDCTHWAY